MLHVRFRLEHLREEHQERVDVCADVRLCAYRIDDPSIVIEGGMC